MANPKTALVVTSIAAPNAVLKSLAEGAKENNIGFIVIGDTKSPSDFSLDGCRFYSVAEQQSLPFRLAKLLPIKHYSRKNIGYLLSKENDVIIETDDDNFPRKEFWLPRSAAQESTYIDAAGWINVYNYFSSENIWPRGFPVHRLNDQHIPAGTPATLHAPIQQGLADENPDVDAIYRMTMKLPIRFDEAKPVSLGNKCWSPFNSQNTTWFKEAFPLMYLPSYCSFRMTDIWRSFVAQRIAWTCNWPVLYHSATVWQERNDHSLLKDFEDEIPGYLNNETICKKLEDLDLKSGVKNLSENLFRCYQMLVSEKYISADEIPLLESWINEF